MKNIIFSDFTELEIDDFVLNKIFYYTQTKYRNESGGILLGKKYANINKYSINDVSVPCPKDKQGRCFFLRNKINAQKIINTKWIESNGIINYLGEWHTHGVELPIPSITDHKLISQIIHDKSNVFEHVFMLILGSKKDLYVGLANSSYNDKIFESKIIKG
ncbi:MAG: hypothetical protein A2Y15_08590 [Clostridiales bacterium GWF2_36_10]|nr:MAG: hypothetical protein A2Y15_08590 [Clostridiales bacterium GWF2_36_10]HAN20401.1 hypothetical protein [Clostridiales bacterium]